MHELREDVLTAARQQVCEVLWGLATRRAVATIVAARSPAEALPGWEYLLSTIWADYIPSRGSGAVWAGCVGWRGAGERASIPSYHQSDWFQRWA